VIQQLKDKGYQIVLLEQTNESVSYNNYLPEAPVCLVVGNEVEGISEEVVDLADKAIDISMDGVKNSLNVSVAFGVVAYHMRNSLSNKK